MGWNVTNGEQRIPHLVVQFLKSVHIMEFIHFLESKWLDPAGQCLHSSEIFVYQSKIKF